jgi:hypothetical protein
MAMVVLSLRIPASHSRLAGAGIWFILPPVMVNVIEAVVS